MQARNELNQLSLEELNQKLRHLKGTIEQTIENRLTICRVAIVNEQFHKLDGENKGFSALLKAAKISQLDILVSSVNSAKVYIFDHANSWSYFTEHQKKKALIDSIQAYQFILNIAENPNASINEEEIEIFKVRHQKRPHFIASIVLLAIATAIVFAFPFVTAFYFPALVANIACLVAEILTIILGIFLPATGYFAYSLGSWVDDQNFCNKLSTSVPTFFGKTQPIEAAKVADTSVAQSKDDESLTGPGVEVKAN